MEQDGDSLSANRIVPVYPATEGIRQGRLRRLTDSVLQTYLPYIEEVLPPDVILKHKLVALQTTSEGEERLQLKKYPFRVRFYYSERGVSEVRQFLRQLPHKHRKKCLYYFNFVRESGTQVPKRIAQKIQDNLYELKPEYQNTEYRFLFGEVAINQFGVVTVLVKKRERLPQVTFDLAAERVETMREKV